VLEGLENKSNVEEVFPISFSERTQIVQLLIISSYTINGNKVRKSKIGGVV
jgi:hypothetical protein